MNKLSITVLVLVALVGAAHAQSQTANWTVTRHNLAQIIGDVAFNSDAHGYLGAFVSGPGPLLLETSDSLEHLQQDNPGFSPIIYWGTAVSNTGAAVVAGVSIPKKGAALYLDQSTGTWTQSETVVAGCNFLEVESVGGADFRMVGTWTLKQADGSRLTQNGVASSSDGGKSWSFKPWPMQDLAPSSASWVSATTAFVSAGQVPAVPEQEESSYLQRISHGCAVREDGRMELTRPALSADPVQLQQRLAEAQRAEAAQQAAQLPLNETFRAVVMRTDDGGETWTTLLSQTSTTNFTGMTITSVEFVDENVGFVSGEAVIQGFPIAFLNKTTDGGKTWNTVFAVPAGILLKVRMYNSTFGFAVGGAPNPNGIFSYGLILNTTDGGSTWQYSLIPKFLAINNVDIVDGKHAYAVGVQSWQLASVLKYQPISELVASQQKQKLEQQQQQQQLEDVRLELEEDIAQLQAELDAVSAILTHFNQPQKEKVE